jgi:hypothetical protein
VREKSGLKGQKDGVGEVKVRVRRCAIGLGLGWSRNWSREYDMGYKVQSMFRASRQMARCTLRCSRNTEIHIMISH